VAHFDEDTLTEFGERTLDSLGGEERRVPTLRCVFEGGVRQLSDTSYPLPPGSVVIGRSVAGKNDIALGSDPKVSRKHARIVVENAGAVIKLVNESRNGTKVNGSRVDGEVQLHDNDVVRVGDTSFILRRKPELERDHGVDGLLGDAPAIQQLRATMGLVGATDSIALLLGETGVGKEVVARGLHRLSGRKGEFVAVNCGAIPESLAESQLFGHSKGSFTGANEDHPGYFRMAKGGTLFLDEVGELSAPLQPKLLRVLDTHEVYAVGATTPHKVDVRVVAATNRDLLDEVKSGRFRGDLYARLAEITLYIPPLRERREDILKLVDAGLGEDAPPMKASLAEALLLHDWPFNVREAMKVAKELQVRGAGADLLGYSLIKERLRPMGGDAPKPVPLAEPTSSPEAAPAGPPIPSREELEELLREHKGVISKVARATGRSRTQVYRWIEQYNLNAESYRT
jgi:transcriptional regulator with GAF, ATPase, and Fis domain